MNKAKITIWLNVLMWLAILGLVGFCYYRQFNPKQTSSESAKTTEQIDAEIAAQQDQEGVSQAIEVPPGLTAEERDQFIKDSAAKVKPSKVDDLPTNSLGSYTLPKGGLKVEFLRYCVATDRYYLWAGAGVSIISLLYLIILKIRKK